MSELRYRASAPASLWQNNPALVQLLGLSPLLAVSTSFANSVGLGLVTALVLIFGSVTVSASRRLINANWRFVVYLAILATYTTFADLLLQLYFYPLHRALGLYLPLVCCNLALLVHLDRQSRHQAWPPALGSAALSAVTWVIAFVAFATLREWLATGRLFGDLEMLLPAGLERAAITNPAPGFFRFALLPPAGLLLLGLLLGLRNWLLPDAMTAPAIPQDPSPVPRARVTGKIQSS